jgi:hypothetical protein
MLKKYGPAWEPDVWYQLVLSVRGGVPLSVFGGPNLAQVWDAMRDCIREFSGSCEGIVGWEELAVYRFWPQVLPTPYVNALIRCCGEPDLRLLAGIIEEQFRRHRLFNAKQWKQGSLMWMPDPYLCPIKSEAHYYECLEYVKPIDFLSPYVSGFRLAKATNQVEEFHQEVRDFFEAYFVETTVHQKRWSKKLRAYYSADVTRCPYFYFGDCHGAAGNSIAIDKGTRRSPEHQELIRARKLEAQEKEANDDEGADDPVDHEQPGDGHV